jgi:two-component system response regulator YesN
LLIVDDEHATRDLLSKFIPWKELGIECVLLAKNGHEALELLQTESIDILLSDIKMPIMNGIDLCKEVKKILPNCKTVFLSAFADIENLKNAIDLNVVKFIVKPIKRVEIKEVMAEIVSQINESNKQMERFNKSTEIVVRQLAYELTHGLGIKSLDEICSLAKLDISNISLFQTVIIAIKSKKNETAAIKNDLLNEILSFFSLKIGENIGCYYDDKCVVVHLLDKEINADKAELIIAGIHNVITLFSTYNINFFVGIGKRVSSIFDIPESYMSAVVALQRNFFIGDGRFAIYNDTDISPFHLKKKDFEDFEQLLCDRNFAAVHKYLDYLEQNCLLNNNTIVGNVKNIYLRVLQIAYDFCVKLCILDTIHNFCDEILEEKVLSFELFSQLHHYTVTILTAIQAQLTDKGSANSLIANVIQYIDENYQHNSLSVQQIATKVYISSNYLCHFFKDKTGKTIHQYTTEVRVNNAKRLLLDRNFKLHEVAKMVGCVNANHFAKLFKKNVGLNPSEYREKHSV